MPPINIFAVLAAAVSCFFLGGFWYSPALFGKTWQREAGDTRKPGQGHPAKVFGMSFAFALGSVLKGHFEHSLDHRQLHHGQEVDRQFLEACADASALLHPTDALFHNTPSSVRVLVEGHFGIVASLLVVLVRNDRLDSSILQELTDPIAAISLIAGQTLRAASRAASLLPDTHLGQHRLESLRVVRLARGHIDFERRPTTIDEDCEFA